MNANTYIQPSMKSHCLVNRVMYGTTVQYLDGGAVGSKIGYVGKELTISVPYLFTCGRPVLID